MRYKRHNKTRSRIISGLLTAAVAICTLPFFIGKTVNAAVISSNALVTEKNTKAAGYKSEKAFRDAILAACKKMDGVKYQWGGGGWNGIDCAGSVSLAYSVALKTAKITGTSGSYGKKTLSYSGGGTPDKYGFERPGFAGIKSSFTNGILKTRSIKPAENRFSNFETNGTKGIQNDEWINIINKYGFKPGDMILWWNDNNDKTNAQHITIYAGIENGTAMHWTASSTSGYFLKKSLASSSSESGKGSFTGFMGLKATALVDVAYVGFTLDKRDPSGINYTGAIFSVFSDPDLNALIGELRDEDGDGIYTDYFALNNSVYTRQKFKLTESDGQTGNYENTVYIQETTAPDGVILPDGTKHSLKDQDGNLPDVYRFIDTAGYAVHIKLTGTDGSKGKLEYSVEKIGGSVMYQTVKNDYSYASGSDVVLITNMETEDSTAGRGKGAGLFTEGSSISLEKITTTAFDIRSTVFTVTEGEKPVATYKFSDGSWNWYDAFGNKWTSEAFPVKYSTEYVVTEEFEKDEAFKCIDGNTIDFEYTNDSGWTKISETAYQYKFKTEGIDSKKTYSFKCENNKLSGEFSADKDVTDKDDTKDGFVFELWNKDMTVKLAEGVSVKDGKIVWKTAGGSDLEHFDVPAGDYVLAEIYPDKGYSGTSFPFTYKIPEGFENIPDEKWIKRITIGTGKTAESVINDRTEGKIKVTKTSEDKKVGDVEFSLFYGGKGNEPLWQKEEMTKGKTDSLGIVYFSNLPTGWYRIDEKVEPAYKAVWDDGTAGRSRIIKINEEDDDKVTEVSVVNKLDINPDIMTTLTDTGDSHDVNCGKSIELKDKVHFENLTAGYEYKIKGSLVDRMSGEVLKDKDGKGYTSEVSFKADSSLGTISKDSQGRDMVSGDVYVKFTVDTSYLYSLAFGNGARSLAIVCVEELYFRDILISEHKDLDDVDQTITVEPKLSTTASDSKTNTGVLTLSETVGINDKVSFEGLNPGDRFIVTGTLMDKLTGEPYVDIEGNTYSKEVPFVPEASEGFVTVSFEDVKVPLDSGGLVVFEVLKIDGIDVPVAAHEDIGDEGQTLRRPSCKTVAATVKGDKTFLSNSTVTIVDHVSYSDLEAGHAYYAKATLKLTDGTEVTNKGNEVVSLQQFEPEAPSGVVDVTIKFKASDLKAGDTVVVIENIYDMSTDEEITQGIQNEDVRVIAHEDLNNKDQSLAVTDLPISGELLRGETVWGFVVFFISTGAGAAVITSEVKRKRIRRTRRW